WLRALDALFLRRLVLCNAARVRRLTLLGVSLVHTQASGQHQTREHPQRAAAPHRYQEYSRRRAPSGTFEPAPDGTHQLTVCASSVTLHAHARRQGAGVPGRTAHHLKAIRTRAATVPGALACRTAVQ